VQRLPQDQLFFHQEKDDQDAAGTEQVLQALQKAHPAQGDKMI
jgi:hypothetical protein